MKNRIEKLIKNYEDDLDQYKIDLKNQDRISEKCLKENKKEEYITSIRCEGMLLGRIKEMTNILHELSNIIE